MDGCPLLELHTGDAFGFSLQFRLDLVADSHLFDTKRAEHTEGLVSVRRTLVRAHDLHQGLHKRLNERKK